MKRICKMPLVLLVWQVAIVDGKEQNLHHWYRLKKVPPAAPITEAQIRLAQGFLRELELEVSDLHALQERYNALFCRRMSPLAALISFPVHCWLR